MATHTPNLIVTEDYAAMSRIACDIVMGQLAQRPDSVLGLATGGTPVGLYAQLCDRHADLSRTAVFNLDEYYPLSRQHPQSFYQFMKQHVYDSLKPLSWDIPDGEADDIIRECARYETAIRESGGLDLQVLGVGRNGHIGFNEPGTSFASRTRLVSLKQETVEDNARFFENASLVPLQAVTMGIATILEAKSIMLLASGSAKAEALRQLFYGRVSTEVPVTALRLHPNVHVIADRQAAALLSVK
ncbi:glucosamine-6-phosphate deaminase [Paenibacillus thalictri]|uniref:Glucosamine-6-phosphate deaminase n=2 Tax=Paenibacillus thalictri TaxID=2527873 RepID=A0A4Q9DSV5_9BACL|nr:glucosamine-6-phosphate deaminase [Paenibacillus thalictri]